MSENPVSLDALRIDRSAPPERRTGRTVLWTVLFLLVAAGIGLGLKRTAGGGTPVRTYAVVAATSDGGRTVLNASGYVVARREATVSSKVTGKVVEILVEEGMKVEAGQVLARLDDTNVRTRLRLAEAELEAARASMAEIRADLELAEKDQQRLRELSRSQVASVAELDQVEARAKALRARLESQQTRIAVAERGLAVYQQELEDTVIRAPFAGIATSKNAQPGEMISPISAGGGFTRTGIGTLVDMTSLEIEVEVNESYLNRVKPGQRVEAALDAYPEWRIPAGVLAIIPTADRQKATVKVRVKFDQLDARMLPQMGVKVAFLGEAGDAKTGVVTVPRAAIRRAEGRDYVVRVRDGRTERRNVLLGLQRSDSVEVSSGLEAGDRVVVEGPTDLAEGARVTEKPR